MTRLSDGTRKVTGVTEITGMEGDVITMQDIFVFDRIGLDAGGPGDRPLPRHRDPAEVRRAAGGVGPSAARQRCSSTSRWWRRHADRASHLRRRGGADLRRLLALRPAPGDVRGRRDQAPTDAGAGRKSPPKSTVYQAGQAAQRDAGAERRCSAGRRRSSAGSSLLIERAGLRWTVGLRASSRPRSWARWCSRLCMLLHAIFAAAAAAGALAACAPFLYVRYRADKRMERFEELFPEAIGLIIRSLRAGHAFTTGLAMVAEEMDRPGRPGVQDALRPAELRHAARGRPEAVHRADSPARRQVLRHGRPDAAGRGRQPGRGPREPDGGRSRSLQGEAAGPRHHRACAAVWARPHAAPDRPRRSSSCSSPRIR